MKVPDLRLGIFEKVLQLHFDLCRLLIAPTVWNAAKAAKAWELIWCFADTVATRRARPRFLYIYVFPQIYAYFFKYFFKYFFIYTFLYFFLYISVYIYVFPQIYNIYMYIYIKILASTR